MRWWRWKCCKRYHRQLDGHTVDYACRLTKTITGLGGPIQTLSGSDIDPDRRRVHRQNSDRSGMQLVYKLSKKVQLGRFTAQEDNSCHIWMQLGNPCSAISMSLGYFQLCPGSKKDKDTWNFQFLAHPDCDSKQSCVNKRRTDFIFLVSRHFVFLCVFVRFLLKSKQFMNK